MFLFYDNIFLVIIMNEEMYLNNVYSKLIGDVKHIKFRTFVVLAKEKIDV